jgi:hypothetical protein
VVYGTAQRQSEEKTRPGEKWRFCAGRKSVFVRGDIATRAEKKRFECDLLVEEFESVDGKAFVANSVFQAHSYVNRLNKIEKEDQLYEDNAHLHTKIIFIDYDHFVPDSAAVATSASPKELLFLEILKESWRRAKYYRDGINSYLPQRHATNALCWRAGYVKLHAPQRANSLLHRAVPMKPRAPVTRAFVMVSATFHV